ncbi:MAG: peroxiredoxin [Ilumatobacteraceae bacterium]|jgi:peroxiredoxin|nr:peroxiredoxin [Ilumatobacteraceae bacterium]NQW59703.1 peroxiredoxin [bacterium]
MSISVGDQAPDFSLVGTGNVTHSLNAYKGKTVVLVFYPGDNTPVCTKQLVCYNNELAQFSELDAQVLALSAQDLESHEKFAAQHGFQFPLLADTEKSVARAYGVLGPLGIPRRSIFVIDASGVVRYVHRALVGVTFRPVEELVAAISAANA